MHRIYAQPLRQALTDQRQTQQTCLPPTASTLSHPCTIYPAPATVSLSSSSPPRFTNQHGPINRPGPIPLYCAFLLSFAAFSLSLSLFSASIALCLSTLALILRMYRRATLCGSPRKSQRATTRSSSSQRTPPCCRCRTFLAAKDFLELPGTVHAPLS